MAKIPFLKYLPYAAAVVIMGVSCYVQGMWSERWGTFPELKMFADQLKEIPKDLGDWKGEDAKETDARILKVAGAEGELVRVYTNAAGQSIQVSIICARMRDIFYHTPDRCYPAAGFEMQGEPQQIVMDVENTPYQFFSTSFMKTESTGSHTEKGYWTWSGDGTWIAPKDYKVEFAGSRALYKLYIFAAQANGPKRAGADDYCEEFVRTFMPIVKQQLRPAFEKAGVAAPEKS